MTAAVGAADKNTEEGAKCDVDMGNAAEASAATAAAGVRPLRPAKWGTITRGQRQRWKQQGGRPRQNSDREGLVDRARKKRSARSG